MVKREIELIVISDIHFGIFRSNYDCVICGHIHQTEFRDIKSSITDRTVTYLNSGDWVESLTALEYQQGKWRIFDYRDAVFTDDLSEENLLEQEEFDGLLDVKNLLERFKAEAR